MTAEHLSLLLINRPIQLFQTEVYSDPSHDRIDYIEAKFLSAAPSTVVNYVGQSYNASMTNIVAPQQSGASVVNQVNNNTGQNSLNGVPVQYVQQNQSQVQMIQQPVSLPPGVIINPAKKSGNPFKNFAKKAGLVAGAATVEAAGLSVGIDVIGTASSAVNAVNGYKIANELKKQNKQALQNKVIVNPALKVSAGQQLKTGQQFVPALTAQQPQVPQNMQPRIQQPGGQQIVTSVQPIQQHNGMPMIQYVQQVPPGGVAQQSNQLPNFQVRPQQAGGQQPMLLAQPSQQQHQQHQQQQNGLIVAHNGQQNISLAVAQQSNTLSNFQANPQHSGAQQPMYPLMPHQSGMQQTMLRPNPSQQQYIYTTSVNTATHVGHQQAALHNAPHGQLLQQQQSAGQVQPLSAQSRISVVGNAVQGPLAPQPVQIPMRRPLAQNSVNGRPNGAPNMPISPPPSAHSVTSSPVNNRPPTSPPMSNYTTTSRPPSTASPTPTFLSSHSATSPPPSNLSSAPVHPSTQEVNAHHQHGSSMVLQYPKEIIQATLKLFQLLEKHHDSHVDIKFHVDYQHSSSSLRESLKILLQSHQNLVASSTPSKPSIHSPQPKPSVTTAVSEVNLGLSSSFSNMSIQSSPPIQELPTYNEAVLTPSGPGSEVPAKPSTTNSSNTTVVVQETVEINPAPVDLSTIGGFDSNDPSKTNTYSVQEVEVIEIQEPGVDVSTVACADVETVSYASTTETTANAMVYSDTVTCAAPSGDCFVANVQEDVTVSQTDVMIAGNGTDSSAVVVQDTSFTSTSGFDSFAGGAQVQSDFSYVQVDDVSSTAMGSYTATSNVTDVTQDTSVGFMDSSFTAVDVSQTTTMDSWDTSGVGITDTSFVTTQGTCTVDTVSVDQSMGGFTDSSFGFTDVQTQDTSVSNFSLF